MEKKLKSKFLGLGRLIGNTPLLEISFTFSGGERRLFAKYEALNMTGSIKDRMALHILYSAYRAREISPGDIIVEATSGNTGISFAAIGRALGHEVSIMMPDWMSRERVELIRSMGAHVIPVTQEQGGFLGSIRLSEQFAEEQDNVFLPSQFSNRANIEAHEVTTGPEIWYQLEFEGLVPDAFVAGVGTGGTVMGVGSYLGRQVPGMKIHPLEPTESPTFSTGHKVGSHRIQGISDEFIPSIVDLDSLDEIVQVHDGDAILMAQKLAAEMGLAVGISSGANFLGALQVLEKSDENSIVTTVFPDDNKKYLSTDLLGIEPQSPNYMSPGIELTGLRVFKRTCEICCEGDDCHKADTDDCVKF
ncbi:MAG: PLP-dependent cysteine synthase family protein [bacterium]